VRGLANKDITAASALKLAQAAAIVLGQTARASGKRPIAVIGRDPRISGEFLAAAISAGLASSGVDVFDAGVTPTPATSFLTADLDADFGVMISASHNPAPDNGIKFFSSGGHKLDDALEDEIEKALTAEPLTPTGSDIGHVQSFKDAKQRYLNHLQATLPNRLNGLKVVVDCANGAASDISPTAFKDAGAEVVVIGNNPDGHNINLGCGSTHLSALQAAVVEHGADVGIAHDGDADRTLAVDATGAVVDGDQIMAILALAAKSRGDLSRDTLVATVMSNLGLRIAMREAGIEMIETNVGDRYVLEVIREGGYTLGGEQSGHLIFAEHATTGDGILTGLQLLAQMSATGKTLKELASAMTVYPQVLINVPGVDKTKVDSDSELQNVVQEAVADLGDAGRVLLRASGTEPLVRVMVEAQDPGLAQSWAEKIARVVEKQLKLS
jgi:phosphoglucosamine mutase